MKVKFKTCVKCKSEFFPIIHEVYQFFGDPNRCRKCNGLADNEEDQSPKEWSSGNGESIRSPWKKKEN